MTGSFREVLADLQERRSALEEQIEQLDTAIAAIEAIAPAPKKATKRRRAKPAARRRRRNTASPRVATRNAPSQPTRRFIAVCPTHKAVFVREGDGYKCTMGHALTEAVVKDSDTGAIEDRTYPVAKAIKADRKSVV